MSEQYEIVGYVNSKDLEDDGYGTGPVVMRENPPANGFIDGGQAVALYLPTGNESPNYKLILQCVLRHLEQMATMREGSRKDLQGMCKMEAAYILTFVERLKE